MWVSNTGGGMFLKITKKKAGERKDDFLTIAR